LIARIGDKILYKSKTTSGKVCIAIKNQSIADQANELLKHWDLGWILIKKEESTAST